eukprot:1160041-Pelagomonas_calceolata.AAC.4
MKPQGIPHIGDRPLTVECWHDVCGLQALDPRVEMIPDWSSGPFWGDLRPGAVILRNKRKGTARGLQPGILGDRAPETIYLLVCQVKQETEHARQHRPTWDKLLPPCLHNVQAKVSASYPLVAMTRDDVRLRSVTSTAALKQTSGMQRRVGVRAQQQVLIGAAILQQRRPLTSLLPGGKRFSWMCSDEGLAVGLSAECSTARVNARMSHETNRGKAAGGSTGAQRLPSPIGVNPVFVNTSAMFSPDVALSPSDWYNTTKASGQVNQQGVPYGFFPKLLPASAACAAATAATEERDTLNEKLLDEG